MAAAASRTIFAQPGAAHVGEQFEVIAQMSGRQQPKVEQLLHEAREDLLAFTGFPISHWKMICRRTPGAARQGVKRRTGPAALLRLVGAVLIEAHDEWQVAADRRYLC